MGATERIVQFIDFKGISKYKFCKDLGFSNKFLDNSSNMGTDKASIILHYFPELNPEWLLTGRGEMIKTNTISIVNEPKSTYNKTNTTPQKGIPLIPIEAMAGYSTGAVQVMEYDTERFIVPTFKGADYLIGVRGSSMYPKYNSGDIVACKHLSLDAFFQWNKVYVLDTVQGALIKRVCKGSTDDSILIVSDNPKFEPFELHRSEINAIAIVMGVIRLE
jgi:phage repressor protein C with HTH and peptisase S24 domain